jgi:hypothetical protein
MIFFHKPYYNLNYTNLNKKILVIYVINPKNYTKHKNYIMQNNFFLKKHKKKFRNEILKLLNYKDYSPKKPLILKKNQFFFVKTKRK